MMNKKRLHRKNSKLHFITENGMVACNPRDKEAAHRIDTEFIATEDITKVTCKKCLKASKKK